MVPLQTAIKRLETLRGMGVYELLIGFSGGKDSAVVLDLCHRLKFRLKAFFYRYMELECEQTLIRFAERRYGLEIIQLPHPGLAALLKSSTLRQRDPSREITVPKITPNDIERVARKRSGYEWIAYGHRKTDSLQRRGRLTKCDGIETRWQRIFPLADMKPDDVIGYLEDRRLPVPSMFGNSTQNTSGVSPTDPLCMAYMRDNYPKDYARLLTLFPHIPAMIARDCVRAKHEIQAELPPIRWAKNAGKPSGDVG